MTTTRSLEARLSAVSNIEDTLEDISDAAERAAGSFNELGIESSVADVSLENTQESADDLSESLDDVLGSAVAAASALETVEHQTDEAGDEASESARDFAKLNASMAAFQGLSLPSSLADDDISATRRANIDTDVDSGPSIGSRIRSKAPDVSLSRTAQVDTEVDREGFSDRLRSRGPDLTASRTLKVDTEVDRDSPRLIDSLQSKMPDLSLSTSGIREAEDETEDLNRDLGKTSTLATAASGALASMGATTLGDRSTLPSPGSGDREGSDGIDMAYTLPSLPDLPSPDFRGLRRGFGGISDTASEAADTVGEVGKGLAQVFGITRNVGGLSRIAGAIGSIGSSAGALSSVVGSLGAILAIVGPALGGLVSIGAALGGLATAAIGLTGAIGGLIGVGLFQIGKQRNPENPFEGIQSYLKGFQDDVREALSPIFELEGLQGFIEGFISGGINVLNDFSELVAQLWPQIQGMFERLGNLWSDNQPEFFYQLEELISAMMPMMEGFIGAMIKSMPGIMKFMREAGTKLLPKMADMFGAIWGAIKPFLPSGMALASILMDLTTIFFELITPISEILGMALTPILQGLAWVLDLLVGPVKRLSNGLSAFLSWLNKWIGALWSAITNLDATQIVKIINNFIGILVVNLTNALIQGFSTLYNKVIKWIRNNIPGAKQAIGAINSASERLTGQKAIPGEINPEPWNPTGMFSDLNPNKPGKQFAPPSSSGTASEDGPSRGERPYVGEMTVYSGQNQPNSRIDRLVRRGVDEASKEAKKRSSEF